MNTYRFLVTYQGQGYWLIGSGANKAQAFDRAMNYFRTQKGVPGLSLVPSRSQQFTPTVGASHPLQSDFSARMHGKVVA